MSNNLSIGQKFVYGMMALLENYNSDSYAFSSDSISAPSNGLNALEHRQFGAIVPSNNRYHLEMQQQQQQPRKRLRRRYNAIPRRPGTSSDGMVFCNYCPNKMLPHSMAGKCA